VYSRLLFAVQPWRRPANRRHGHRYGHLRGLRQ